MKFQIVILLAFLHQYSFSQVVLSADGPGETYELITSVLAPGQKPIETPDCNHVSFGDHIDELFDEELNTNVFRFYIHTEPDNDRCINFDRQRNEIKSYDKSPDNLLGVEGERVKYKWKFKLDAGFQSSPNFTHLHQLKSVGGDLASMPMYTLTTRKGNPDQLELRYAETDKQVTLIKTDLEPFINTWLEVTETIEYGESGAYEIIIKRLTDETILFSYADESIVNWRPEADFVRPKWGIYRSLLNAQDLRDEVVRYADFSVEEIQTTSSLERINSQIEIYPNPSTSKLYIKNSMKQIETFKIFNIEGRELFNKNFGSTNSLEVDVSSLQEGVYIINLIGAGVSQSSVFMVSH